MARSSRNPLWGVALAAALGVAGLVPASALAGEFEEDPVLSDFKVKRDGAKRFRVPGGEVFYPDFRAAIDEQRHGRIARFDQKARALETSAKILGGIAGGLILLDAALNLVNQSVGGAPRSGPGAFTLPATALVLGVSSLATGVDSMRWRKKAVQVSVDLGVHREFVTRDVDAHVGLVIGSSF